MPDAFARRIVLPLAFTLLAGCGTDPVGKENGTGGSGGGGEGGSGGQIATDAVLPIGSFIVAIEPQYGGHFWREPPARIDALLHIDANGDRLAIGLLDQRRYKGDIRLEGASPSGLRASAPFAMTFAESWPPYGGYLETLEIDVLELEGVDLDEDGEADAVRGRMAGKLTVVGEGADGDAPFDVTFEGRVDDEAPAGPADCVIEPIGKVALEFAEPLVYAGDATLSTVDARTWTASLSGRSPFTLEAQLDDPLPLGAAVEVEIAATDLAGHALPSFACNVLAPAPGEASDSFESGDLAGHATVGAVEVHAGDATLPAIDGAYVALGQGYFTLYREIDVPDTTAPALELNVRALRHAEDHSSGQWTVGVEVTTVDAKASVKQELPLDGEDLEQPGPFAWMSSPVDLRIDLAEMRGQRALVRITGGPGQHGCPAPLQDPATCPSLLLDGLRVTP